MNILHSPIQSMPSVSSCVDPTSAAPVTGFSPSTCNAALRLSLSNYKTKSVQKYCTHATKTFDSNLKIVETFRVGDNLDVVE